MKKLYIIISSWDEYDDHYKVNELVCSSLFFAETKKAELENKYKEEIPFPFDWCTYQEFERLQLQGKTAPEDDNVFNQWYDLSVTQELFNCCFIKEIDYYEK